MKFMKILTKTSEKQIEQRLVKKVKEAGGLALKFVSPGFAGVPDRIVFMPDGRVWLVECKAPGEYPRTLQQKRFAMFERMGHVVAIVDSYESVDAFVGVMKE
jgi:hypothetical protein